MTDPYARPDGESSGVNTPTGFWIKIKNSDEKLIISICVPIRYAAWYRRLYDWRVNIYRKEYLRYVEKHQGKEARINEENRLQSNEEARRRTLENRQNNRRR